MTSIDDQWVKLKDSLLEYPYPLPEIEVLVTAEDSTGHRRVFIALYDNEWKNPDGSPFSEHWWRITHWRHLPSPAKS